MCGPGTIHKVYRLRSTTAFVFRPTIIRSKVIASTVLGSTIFKSTQNYNKQNCFYTNNVYRILQIFTYSGNGSTRLSSTGIVSTIITSTRYIPTKTYPYSNITWPLTTA